jgi:uncharacterized protein YjiS (DUF1127 family)
MNDHPSPASNPCETCPQTLLASWRERIQARWRLARMAQENPHLLKDIGLTMQQVETEIAKPFWRR